MDFASIKIDAFRRCIESKQRQTSLFKQKLIFLALFRALKSQLPSMAQFHFVDDYQQHVRTLLDTHSRDEAMSLAVGGEWDRLGEMLSDFVLDLGVSNGMRLLDFGCGSGRLAYYLKQKCELSGYVGLDVVDELLDYAREKVPTPEYVFQNNQSLSLPTDLGVFDVICSFSVFTHLLQTEIYLYLRAMEQSLVPGGQFIFSFIELDTHWPVFELSCEAHAHHGQPHPHLNQFLEKSQVTTMLQHLGFETIHFVEADRGIGQTVAIAIKPMGSSSGV